MNISFGRQVYTISDNFFILWIQRLVRLKPLSRAFHVITNEVVTQPPEIRKIEVGVLHLFIQHTSSSLAINENVSPEVRRDLGAASSRTRFRRASSHEHTLEGAETYRPHQSVVDRKQSDNPYRSGQFFGSDDTGFIA
jgi:thiamine phosphate synthase YjbQ (UPF0047 family)